MKSNSKEGESCSPDNPNSFVSESDNFADSIIESVLGVFYVIGSDLRFRKWNRNFEEVVERSAKEMASISPLDLFEGNDKTKIEAAIGKVFQQGSARVEASFVTSSGMRIPYLFTGSKKELNGEEFVIGTGVDVSDRTQAQEELEEIFNRSLDIICIADLHSGIFTKVNQAFSRILGFERAEIEGSSFLELIHPDDLQSTIDIVNDQLLQDRKVLNFENRYRSKKGEYRWLSWVSYPDADKAVTYALARDITEKKEIEQELLDLNASLAQRVKERTSELEKNEKSLIRFGARLEDRNREMQQFTYLVSHDLKSPLVNLEGYTGEIEYALKTLKTLDLKHSRLEFRNGGNAEELSSIIEDDLPEAMHFIRQSVDRIDRYIKGLLELSRLGQREVVWEDVDLRKLMSEITDSFGSLMTKKNATISIADLPVIESDRFLVEQIFLNLISNAVKYSAEYRANCINISSSMDTDGVYVRVCDTGIGISENNIEKVFAPFKRIEPNNEEGDGMGLSFVQATVQKLGGRIWCESEKGKGSVFTVFVPFDHIEKVLN